MGVVDATDTDSYGRQRFTQGGRFTVVLWSGNSGTPSGLRRSRWQTGANESARPMLNAIRITGCIWPSVGGDKGYCHARPGDCVQPPSLWRRGQRARGGRLSSTPYAIVTRDPPALFYCCSRALQALLGCLRSSAVRVIHADYSLQ